MIENIREKLHMEWLFYAYYVIMLFTKGLGFADGPVYKVCVAAASAIVLVKILLERHSRREWALIIALLGCGAVNWVHTGNQGALLCILLVLAMKGVNLADAFAVGAICWGLSYVFQLVTQLLDLRARDFVIHSKFGFQHIIRWALGYTHPNVLQIATLALIAYVLYTVRYQTMRQLRILMIAAVVLSGYIFLYSLSVTGMSMTLAFLIILGYFEYNRSHGRERSRIENILLHLIFPVCVLFSVLAPVLLQGRAFELLNKVMTHRPELSRFFLTTYGISPFGAVYEGLISNYTLDCSYVNLLMHGGAVLFCIMCAGYLWLIHDLLQQAPSRENSVAIAITLYTVIGAVSEPFAFNTSYKNVSLLILGARLYQALQPGAQEAAVSRGGQIADRVNGRARTLYHRLAAARKGCGRRLLIAAAMGILCGGIYGWLHAAPQEVYALRAHSDEVTYYTRFCLTQDEVNALRADENNWVMEYYGPEMTMVHFSNEGIGEIETVRTQITMTLVVMGAMYAVMARVRSGHHAQ